MMGIEPITRKEMFMASAAGESISTPTPVTREEYFLSKIGGGGGGGGASSADVFIIHAITDETFTNVQLDKTAEQIYEAYQSGKYCLAAIDGTFVPVVSVKTHNAQTNVICGGVILSRTGQGHFIMASFVTDDGVTWSEVKAPMPTMYDVCFTGLKINNQDNIPYTISVDAAGNITATRYEG